MAMASAMGGVYDIPLIAFQTSGVFTNTTPVDAYRGAGKPEANYLIERCIDIAAHQLGMDALKLRRKNIVRRFPASLGDGACDRAGQLWPRDRSCDQGRATAFKARQRESRKRGRLRGLGYACFLETARGTPTRWPSWRSARTTHPHQRRHAIQRPGHETTYAPDRCRCARLPLELFSFRQGDTDDLDSGGGPWRARAPCTRAARRC
jgi:carbon-monoxide dehydrogenase large subunit